MGCMVSGLPWGDEWVEQEIREGLLEGGRGRRWVWGVRCMGSILSGLVVCCRRRCCTCGGVWGSWVWVVGGSG